MTTIAQLEERLAVLEQAVARLQNGTGKVPEPILTEDDIIPGMEYDLVTNVPPKATFQVRAKIVSIEQAPPILGLSAEEWASLDLEDDGE